MNQCCLLALLGAALLCAACERDAQPAVAQFPAVNSNEPTQAQPQLETKKIYVGSQEMLAELALTERQRNTGMMFRTNMAENAGMLFPLPYTQQTSFWMKNCPYPLSAAYIDEEGIIQEIHDFQPYNTNSVVSARDNIRFVLETQQGWFERHHITTNVAVSTESGPLMQTFFPKR